MPKCDFNKVAKHLWGAASCSVLEQLTLILTEKHYDCQSIVKNCKSLNFY